MTTKPLVNQTRSCYIATPLKKNIHTDIHNDQNLKNWTMKFVSFEVQSEC